MTLANTARTARKASENGDYSRSETVYRNIRAEIVAGRIVPGQRIREGAMAERYEVSRTPIREAIKRLTAEGLLTIEGNRGVSVKKLSPQEMLELYAMREVLEGTAARFAAETASEWEIQNLRAIAERLKETGNMSAEEMAQRNRDIHQAIYAMAHNTFLMTSLNSLQTAMQILGPTTFSLKGRSETAHAEHMKIVEAIAAKKPDEAERCARDHIQQAYRARLAIAESLNGADSPDD